MSFLHLQLAVAGLACVGIPILIHLLMRRRRRPVMWGAMRFLLEAYKKNRRRLMVEKWLLLATRCLLVALLGLAIGRPLVGALVGGASGRTVYILLDNGLTSGVVSSDASALSRHKELARKVLDSLSGSGTEGDRAALVTLGSPADGVVLPASADVPAVASLVQGITRTDSRTEIPAAISVVASAIEADRARAGARAGRTFVVILSDFLEGSADLSASLAKLPAGVRVLASTPAGSGSANVGITGVEPLRSVVVMGKQAAPGPGAEGAGGGAGGASASGGDQVRVMLRRYGPSVAQEGSSDIVLRLAGVRERAEQATLGEVGRASVRWAPGQETATASLQATRRGGAGGADAGRGALTEVLEVQVVSKAASENSLAGDDVWRRPVEVRDALRVGIVSPRRFGARDRVDRLDASEWLRLALQPGDDAGIEVTDLDPSLLDGARLAGLDAVCVPRPDLLAAEHWARLRLFLENGGMVLVMPPADVQVHLWSDALVKEFGLPWQVAREAKVFGDPGGTGAPATIAASEAPGEGPQGLLSLIQSELGELARAVSVWKVLPVQTERTEGERLLALNDGSTLVLAQAYGGVPVAPAPEGTQATQRTNERGLVVYLGVAPDLGWTDMPAKPLMVPLVQELVREGVGRAHGSWWSIAGARPSVPGRSAELHPIELLGGGVAEKDAGAEVAGTVPVDETGVTGVALRRAGLWRAVDERGGERGVVAVNPDSRGSRTGAQETASVEQWLGRSSADSKVTWIGAEAERAGPGAGSGTEAIGTVLARESAGSPISLPLLIAALAVAVFELWLARWASHAGVAVRGKGATA